MTGRTQLTARPKVATRRSRFHDDFVESYAPIDSRSLWQRRIISAGETQFDLVGHAIAVEWTVCRLRYGVEVMRPWFLCPRAGERCLRRVACLYPLPGGLACRKCADLLFYSQRNDAAVRAANRRLRVRSEMEARLLGRCERRPGMWRRTHKRLLAKLTAVEQGWLGAMTEATDRLARRVEKAPR